MEIVALREPKVRAPSALSSPSPLANLRPCAPTPSEYRVPEAKSGPARANSRRVGYGGKAYNAPASPHRSGWLEW